jgi:hypothetical protein
MCDYSQYLDGDLSEYVLCQPDPNGSRLETCVIWHTPTGGVMTMVDGELYLKIVRWMVEKGVPILREPPLTDEQRKKVEVRPEFIRDFQAAGFTLAREEDRPGPTNVERRPGGADDAS